MAKQGVFLARHSLVPLIAVAMLSVVPPGRAEVPALVIQRVSATAATRAIPRFTSVVSNVSDSDQVAEDELRVNLSGVVANAGSLPFQAQLRIFAGPSFKVDETVSNMIEAVEGTFEFGDSVTRRQWTVTGVRDGHLFPKSYFLNGDDLRIMLPMEFKRVAAGQAESPGFPLQGDPDGTIRAIFVLRCEVENQALRCISLKSVFGDVLNERVKSSRTVSDLLPIALATSLR